MKKIIVLLLITISTIFYGFAQDNKIVSSGSKTCTNIHTNLENSKTLTRPVIKVKWTSPQNLEVKEIALYRHTEQILSSTLQQLTPIAKLPAGSQEYTDTIDNDSTWYYAAISVLQDGKIYDVVIPSVNATVIGLSATPQKKSPYIATNKRVPQKQNERELIPLPYLNMLARPEETKKTLDDETLKVAASFRAAPTKQASKPLYVFPEDKETTGSGEQYLLAQIINSSFISNDWDTAEEELKQFLKVNRSVEITRRANFYLGQVFYYQGYYRESLNSFIIAENAFPAKTKQWIQAVLEKMPN